MFTESLVGHNIRCRARTPARILIFKRMEISVPKNQPKHALHTPNNINAICNCLNKSNTHRKRFECDEVCRNKCTPEINFVIVCKPDILTFVNQTRLSACKRTTSSMSFSLILHRLNPVAAKPYTKLPNVDHLTDVTENFT